MQGAEFRLVDELNQLRNDIWVYQEVCNTFNFFACQEISGKESKDIATPGVKDPNLMRGPDAGASPGKGRF